MILTSNTAVIKPIHSLRFAQILKWNTRIGYEISDMT
jgi:hypothetical protein